MMNKKARDPAIAGKAEHFEREFKILLQSDVYKNTIGQLLKDLYRDTLWALASAESESQLWKAQGQFAICQALRDQAQAMLMIGANNREKRLKYIQKQEIISSD